jgi:uncharacterized protein YjbI with pentapeptide repeats
MREYKQPEDIIIDGRTLRKILDAATAAEPVNLKGAELPGVYLKYADLNEANLWGAKLTHA